MIKICFNGRFINVEEVKTIDVFLRGISYDLYKNPYPYEQGMRAGKTKYYASIGDGIREIIEFGNYTSDEEAINSFVEFVEDFEKACRETEEY